MHKVIWEQTNLNLGKQIINCSEDNYNGITPNSSVISHYALGFSFIENKNLITLRWKYRSFERETTAQV